MATAADIRAVAEPALADEGLQLWDIELAGDIVRILVERDGGVDLEALTTASHAISALLDDHDELVPIKSYQLEVSSPGLERKLRTPEQYRRYLGTTIAVKTSIPVAGGRRHRGVLSSVDDTGIVLLPDTEPDTPLRLELDRIERAVTVVDWGEALKQGSRPTTEPRKPARSAASTARDIKDPSR